METQENTDRQRRILIGRTLGFLIVLGAIVTGSQVWRINYQHPRTNDAMIRANIVGITAEVNGRIVELPVEDNQFVHKGQLLYVIDPRPYQVNSTLSHFIPAPLESVWRVIPWPFVADNVAY